MSGATLTLKYEDTELERMASRLERALRRADYKPLLRDIGGSLRESTTLRFQQSKAPDGSTWPKSQRVLLFGGQTLILTGRLRDSIADAAPLVDATSVEVGTNVEYADPHQFGAVIPPHVIEPRNKKALMVPGVGPRRRVNHPGGVIEARPFLGVSVHDEAEILDLTERWLKRLVNI